MFSVQASGILMQPAKISKENYHFYKVIQKQICDTLHHMGFQQAGDITVQTS
jgi:hypothetical protein